MKGLLGFTEELAVKTAPTGMRRNAGFEALAMTNARRRLGSEVQASLSASARFAVKTAPTGLGLEAGALCRRRDRALWERSRPRAFHCPGTGPR